MVATANPPAPSSAHGRWSDRATAVPPITLQTLLREFEGGASYQRSLIPKLPPVPDYDLYKFQRAAHLLSGDYFDCFSLARGRLGLLVADASGKGISGALVAVGFRSVIRNLPRDRYEMPRRFITAANTLLIRSVRRGIFVSAIYAVLDPARHEVTVANAGHLPMLVHHADRNEVVAYAKHGPVLGVLSTKQYESEISETTVQLRPRDRLILFTDGVNEAKAPSQDDFRLSHLYHRLLRDRAKSSKDMIRNVVDEVDIHRSGWEQSDDITIVAAQRTK
jgi:sigma-B regulation protein RsbU (phosphoserine phosphatase)